MGLGEDDGGSKEIARLGRRVKATDDGMKQTRSKDSGPEEVDSPAEKGKVDVSADAKNEKEDITSGIDKDANSSLDEMAEGNGKEKEKEVKVEVETECIGGNVVGESVPRKLNGVAGREQCLAMDEMSGVVEFRAIYNDGTRASMKSLILLKVGTMAVIDDGIFID